MLHLVDWYIVTDVSEGCSATIFRVKQSKSFYNSLGLVDSEGRPATFLRNVGNIYQSTKRNMPEDLNLRHQLQISSTRSP